MTEPRAMDYALLVLLLAMIGYMFGRWPGVYLAVPVALLFVTADRTRRRRSP